MNPSLLPYRPRPLECERLDTLLAMSDDDLRQSDLRNWADATQELARRTACERAPWLVFNEVDELVAKVIGTADYVCDLSGMDSPFDESFRGAGFLVEYRDGRREVTRSLTSWPDEGVGGPWAPEDGRLVPLRSTATA
jgi:hypothetical protein